MATYLIFTDQDTQVYWVCYKNLTEQELKILKFEINQYNKWMKRLFLGLVPETSYEDPADANNFLIANNLDYAQSFQRPGDRIYYEDFGCYNFKIRTKLKSNMVPGSVDELEDLLIKPYGYEEIYIGFRVLPMTQKFFIDMKKPLIRSTDPDLDLLTYGGASAAAGLLISRAKSPPKL